MINRLKKKFIALAMASLIALLTVIVAGMNIINYNAVVSEADETLEMLSSNKGRMPKFFNDGWDNRLQDIYGEDPSASYDDIEAGTGDYGSKPGGGYGHDGFAPKGFSRDEAEETRFFTVLLDSDDSVITVNTDRIYAVDENEAEEYAAEAVASGNTCGFIDDYRYCVKDESDYTRITFMDCGRLLGSFRKFLYASIIMSVIGLAAVFVIICYFAGRIVRPVAVLKRCVASRREHFISLMMSGIPIEATQACRRMNSIASATPGSCRRNTRVEPRRTTFEGP